MKDFVQFLVKVDEKIFQFYKDEGIKWFGREVTQVGLFGALGKYTADKKLSFANGLDDLNHKLLNNIEAINLSGFESMRNQLDLGKINIGNVNKNAIYEAALYILNHEEDKKIKPLDWRQYFL